MGEGLRGGGMTVLVGEEEQHGARARARRDTETRRKCTTRESTLSPKRFDLPRRNFDRYANATGHNKLFFIGFLKDDLNSVTKENSRFELK
jgi:hypothetical protein